MEAALPIGETRQSSLVIVPDEQPAEPGFDLAHGSVEVPNALELVEYTIAVPRDTLKEPRVHLFVPGFGGFKLSSRKVRNAMAEREGFVVASYDPPRFGGLKNDLFEAQKVHCDTVAAILEDLPNNPTLQDTAKGNAIDFNEAALTPHSMGGVPAVLYALSHPDNVDKVIKIATVGDEAPVRLGFVPRLGRSAKNEFLKAAIKGEFGGLRDGVVMGARALRYYGVNPVRTIGEMVSCMGADYRPHLAALGEMGVKRALYLPENDQLIPALSSVKGASHLVDHWEIAEGLDHLAPQTKPLRVASDLARISLKLSNL